MYLKLLLVVLSHFIVLQDLFLLKKRQAADNYNSWLTVCLCVYQTDIHCVVSVQFHRVIWQKFQCSCTWEELNNLLLAAAKGKASESQHAAAAAVIVSRTAAFQHPVHLTTVWLEHWFRQIDRWTMKLRKIQVICSTHTQAGQYLFVQGNQYRWAKTQTFTCMANNNISTVIYWAVSNRVSCTLNNWTIIQHFLYKQPKLTHIQHTLVHLSVMIGYIAYPLCIGVPCIYGPWREHSWNPRTLSAQ